MHIHVSHPEGEAKLGQPQRPDEAKRWPPPERVRGQFGLAPGQPPAALWGFLKGENTFQREPDRL